MRIAEGRLPTLRERTARRLFHLWPLRSGCGRIASGSLARWFVPAAPDAVWGQVDNLPCLAPLDDLVGRAVFLVGDLDPKVTWVLNRAVRTGDTVVDVGANIGLVTLQMRRRVGRSGRVLAFEPSPVVLPFLRASLSRTAGVELFEIAVGRAEARLRLSVPVGNAGSASLLAEPSKSTAFEVAVRPLGAVLAECGVGGLDFLKIDVEGFEAEVLHGLFDCAGAPRPSIILFEEHAPDRSCAIATLRDAGYRIFGLRPGALLRVSLLDEGAPRFSDCRDFVAVAPDLSADRLAALGVAAS